MKRYAVAVLITVICLGFTVNFAQSRRTPPADNSPGKVNQRAPKPIESPTPATQEEPQFKDEAPVEDKDIIRVDTDLVAIPVKISDRKGRFISGLTKENFQIFEDDAPQEIAYFTNEEQPFTVALVLDMSYSSTFKITEIQSAAMAFIAQLRPNDKVMVVSFDQEVHVLCNPTSDRKTLQTAIKSTKIASGTSLYDAVDVVINQKFRGLSGRKAMVLFTDGVDTTSYHAFAVNNLSDALELDALVYPVQYDTFNDVQNIKNKPVITQPPTNNPFPVPTTVPSNPLPFPIPVPNVGGATASSQGTSPEDYRKAGEYLNELANRTSGRLYKAGSTGNLALAFSNIAAELRQYYSLGYYPKTQGKTGSKRKLKVRVNQEGLVVRARDFYIVGKKDK
jgi:Ca-activated chloride channel family protein